MIFGLIAIGSLGLLFILIMNYIWAKQDANDNSAVELLNDLKTYSKFHQQHLKTLTLEELKSIDDVKNMKCNGKNSED